MKKNIIVTGAFDMPGSQEIRFLHEASRHGNIHLGVIDDLLFETLVKKKPVFPLSERLYFLNNIRYVYRIQVITTPDQLHHVGDVFDDNMDLWVDLKHGSIIPDISVIAEKQSLPVVYVDTTSFKSFPEHDYDPGESSVRRVVVTGCFDFLHTGHIRFFEEASGYGDLYVILGHDKNIKMLKGTGHPMFSEEERKYVVGSIRFVKQSLISSGDGWLDGEPEIAKINPHCYVVNEDGDRIEKRDFCKQNGIEYIVLDRKPKPGLQRRNSTSLRGF